MSRFSELLIQEDSQYGQQIERIRSSIGNATTIEQTVEEAAGFILEGSDSFVIYGEPQSGKTEMMICLVAKLLDLGFKSCVILVNDSIDLLNQNLQRFQSSGLSPTPERLETVTQSLQDYTKQNCVVFCKKNSHDLKKLIKRLKGTESIVVIDDEADYATPNAKINQDEKTRINELVLSLKMLAQKNLWVGVTATPARLDLNNTLENDRTRWVRFEPHAQYCGHNIFFPPAQQSEIPWTLIGLPDTNDQPKFLVEALCRFLVNVAEINCDLPRNNQQNFSMIVHTSGLKRDHEEDRKIVDKFFIEISNANEKAFEKRFQFMEEFARDKYGDEKTKRILSYIARNRMRKEITVINSSTDKDADVVSAATNPRVPFTIAIGGNIISRGVTFNNLLSMYFTRTTKNIQQDTYIQRARMFGNRVKYLKYFELHIQQSLYRDWHECFTLHRLAIASIVSGRPVWPELGKIRAVANNSVDKANVVMDRREVEFELLEFSEELERLTASSTSGSEHFERILAKLPTDYFANHLLDFINSFNDAGSHAVVWHKTGDIEGFSDADSKQILRKRGFFGQRDLEASLFPNAVHHFKFYKNANGKARLFYKYTEGKLRFVKWRAN